MKRREVVTSPRARADLRRIYTVIADAGAPDNALHFVERLAEFCGRLDVASERGHRRDDVRAGLRIIGFERRVTVAFTVDDTSVTILRLFYGGRDWEAAF